MNSHSHQREFDLGDREFRFLATFLSRETGIVLSDHKRQMVCGRLVKRLRALGLAGTELARAQVSTIRLKLLKIGAVVLRNTRQVRLLLSSSYPYQAIFRQVVKALGSS